MNTRRRRASNRPAAARRQSRTRTTAAQPTDGSATESAPDPDKAFGHVAKAAGTIAGSTTAIAALLFYFGWSRAFYFYDYLGVDSSILDLTTRDYIQLSVDGLFVPIVTAACLTFALVATFTMIKHFAPSALNHRAVPVAELTAGALLLANGFSRLFFATPLNRGLLIAPACLLVGSWLLFTALRRSSAPANHGDDREWTSVLLWAGFLTVLGASLFWAANDYSADVGRGRAQQLVAELPMMPSVRMYSKQSLELQAAGAVETACQVTDEDAYHFRYDNLKLILRSGDAYLLLPADWSPAHGVSILMQQNDTTRLEFSPTGAPFAKSADC